MGRESLVAIKVLETARPMRHSAREHPSGPAAVRPREQAGHTTASNDSRRNEHFPLASRGPSTHDRKDARGIAQLLRMGWYRPVHRKSPDAREVRALLVGRKLLQAKLRDVELSIRGLLRGFGLKVGEVSKGRFAARVGELVAGDAMVRTALYEAANAMLTRSSGVSALKRWAMGVAKRRGAKRAKVALARKLAGVLHRMWANATDFRWGKEEAIA